MLKQRLQPFFYLRELLFLLYRDAAYPVRPASQRRCTVNHFHRGAYSSWAQAGYRVGCEISSLNYELTKLNMSLNYNIWILLSIKYLFW